MAKTIGNPLSWTADAVLGAASVFGGLVGGIGGGAEAAPEIRPLGREDLRAALRAGIADMATFRSDVVFVCLLYPLVGAALTVVALQGNLVQLLFPLLSGFALVGPVAALGLYEMSRRRERGEENGWSAYLEVLRSPRFGGILALSVVHLVIFMVWIMTANLIYAATLALEPPVSPAEFASAVFGTTGGWVMIVLGCGIGFLFACLVLAMSVVSFPLMLDRDVGVVTAVLTSLRVARENTGAVGAWGLTVAVLLALGTLPAMIGLVVVMPLLGHATWHLYRRAVV